MASRVDALATKYLRPRKIPSTACGGCGLGQVHKQVIKAVDELGLGLDDIVWGTGIGCAGRQTFNTWKGDNFAGTHGRAYVIATGLKLALPPDKKIILTVGDGDAFSIGLAHLMNCARRNVGMTVVVLDNLGYMSTGGQYGVSTPKGIKTDSSPYGMYEPNWLQKGAGLMGMLREAGATFLARHTSIQGPVVVESVKKALLNNGFSLVQVIYPCVTNFSGVAFGSRDPLVAYRWLKEHTVGMHDETTKETCFRTGIYHDASNTRIEYSELQRGVVSDIQRREYQ
jgi:2-oxoglutarate ferredoxin oxidoreductase subunit beta